MTFDIQQAAANANAAKNAIANLSQGQRKQLLESIATLLVEATPAILAANQKDLDNARAMNMSSAMIDRLGLDEKGVQGIAKAVNEIANQDEVLGSIANIKPLPSGIQVGKMRIPLGVVAMIYESRPNVTIDAAALCLKAGNAVILRGGKEAQHSNQALAKVLHQALKQGGLPEAIATVIPVPDREVMAQMLTLSESIDLVIPRGGEGLINYVSQNSKIPVIQHFKGVCHLYIDAHADLDKALPILENGKTQRTGVCNALETLLVHKDIAEQAMPLIDQLFADKAVKVHACEKSLPYFKHAKAQAATEADWEAEYLDLEIAVKIVDDFDAGVSHIQTYGSGHTEVIVTESLANSQRFMREVNSSVIMLNASSRFSDGGELGLGAEIGISTSKLHAYGPMGAQQLTTEKFVVYGDGHIRA
ncbi:glutamate-5-semialdehyde dehydrogenase [Glaciecola sp. XM2]|jgi:glutamate-5-semialdehyde dehydrogenase|uniref:glutamate-5-semialdehyde dehydrogenase n=1 Tax=Glaciecola sp. XM2 TaxID=1914931 RepID=UPI001BDDF98C|nr:glutamate-5-semialdehyde dehydrogenase [Glaciecola sp. XM2]MBT1451477.1 glutamate-5-semialdehyde dehydrogenase [Glaciecola sp. XM2]